MCNNNGVIEEEVRGMKERRWREDVCGRRGL